MTVAQYVTFLLDGHLYGVDISRVQEVLRHHRRTEVPLAPDHVAGLINLRGDVVTAIDVRGRLGLPRHAEDGRSQNVVVRVGHDVVSLLVDGVGDVIEVDDAHFEPPPQTLTGPNHDLLHGTYTLEEQLLLVLDVDRVVDV